MSGRSTTRPPNASERTLACRLLALSQLGPDVRPGCRPGRCWASPRRRCSHPPGRARRRSGRTPRPGRDAGQGRGDRARLEPLVSTRMILPPGTVHGPRRATRRCFPPDPAGAGGAAGRRRPPQRGGPVRPGCGVRGRQPRGVERTMVLDGWPYGASRSMTPSNASDRAGGDLEHAARVAGDPVDLQDLRPAGAPPGSCRMQRGAVAGHPDQRDHGTAGPGQVDVGVVAGDHPGLLQPADPLGDGRRGQVHPPGQLAEGEPGVRLQLAQQRPVHVVHDVDLTFVNRNAASGAWSAGQTRECR